MFNLIKLIKIVGSFCLMLPILSCATTKKDDVTKLKDFNYGLMTSIDLDRTVYSKAVASELTPITQELYKSTLLKISLIRQFEKQFGVSYKIEDELNIHEINSLCLAGNFLKSYEKYKPKQIDESENYNWIDKKQQIWKVQLNEHFGEKMQKNDCRQQY